ncbi:hypothetical protein MSPP1_000745 [Malassezia sp. CBS 17886]|nr:hypothetical protein MSPP1_000745 [Malassezia sp. CBS 17886]
MAACQQPVRDPTNSYFTPKQTFTPITTFKSVEGGQVTQVTGVGPSNAPSPYTWNYTAPPSTMSPTANPSLSSSLEKAGIPLGPSASDLQPNTKDLQVVGAASRTDARGALLGAVLAISAALVAM